MNLRQAVLCQRLRARSRGWGELYPATEEDLRAAEEQLGFTLPAMLRAVYLHMSNGLDLVGRFALYGVPLSSRQEPQNDPGWDAYQHWLNDHRLVATLSPEEADADLEPIVDAPAAPNTANSANTAVSAAPSWAYLEALRQHPGTSCFWNELGFPPEGAPDHWVYLAEYVGLWVWLDGDTGYLYYHEADYYPDPREDLSLVSFCAPSVEDWLERELDASSVVRLRYYPGRKHLDVLPGVLADVAGQERTASGERQAHLETERLRAENLGDEGPDPVEKATTRGIWYRPPNTLQVRHVGWELEQARHHMLRQLYQLMDIIERADTDTTGAWGGGTVPGELEAIIEADAQLAPMIDPINRGTSSLFQRLRTTSDSHS